MNKYFAFVVNYLSSRQCISCSEACVIDSGKLYELRLLSKDNMPAFNRH